ncbi:UNVERIFIED_CONTAM: hypothetical protein Sindi_0241500 [Sesamum indicum]
MAENARLKQEANQVDVRLFSPSSLISVVSLRQKLGCARNGMEQGNSAESITNFHQDLVHRPDEDSDTSLKLGLPFSNGN